MPKCRKYRFTRRTYRCSSTAVLFKQIQAVSDFGRVKAGDFGGWIESRANLDESGDCWIGPGAMVSGYARVLGNAQVSGDCSSGDCNISGDVQITDNAYVYNCEIQGNVVIKDCATVLNSDISGRVCISNYAVVHTDLMGDVKVGGNSVIYMPPFTVVQGYFDEDAAAYLDSDAFYNARQSLVTITAIGSDEEGVLTIFPSISTTGQWEWRATRGCFAGTLDDFVRAVKKTYVNGSRGLMPTGQKYLAYIRWFKRHHVFPTLVSQDIINRITVVERRRLLLKELAASYPFSPLTFDDHPL